MVRPVEGFLANDGTYFSTEKECEAYEATKECYKTCSEAIEGLHLNLTPTGTRYLIEFLMDFVVKNHEVIARYAAINPLTLTQPNDIRKPDSVDIGGPPDPPEEPDEQALDDFASDHPDLFNGVDLEGADGDDVGGGDTTSSN